MCFWSLAGRHCNLRHMVVTNDRCLEWLQNEYKSGHGAGDRTHTDQFSGFFLPIGRQDINCPCQLVSYCPGHNKSHITTMAYKCSGKLLSDHVLSTMGQILPAGSCLDSKGTRSSSWWPQWSRWARSYWEQVHSDMDILPEYKKDMALHVPGEGGGRVLGRGIYQM